ncbi:MAG: NADH-quinone oxidoreductase subunit F [Deltaproteobacteria bacterium CG11_big_fil_rev_8_21_14_0_20_45_16]|nr:MAG: NADH-quinone oxidoreductase subunit F [Deltaproteobacteria bacterium CG11_big_fil_rev_8_21_14_0_20_45_16]
MEHVLVPGIERIDTYESKGGYQALKKVLQSKMDREQLIKEVQGSSVRGRGGAGFPTGNKWNFVPKTNDKPHYLLCNADESEPGTFKDRVLLERLPHMMIEGMIIGSYAIQAAKSYVYIRGEYTYAAEIVEIAIQEAYNKGYLGKNILGSGFSHDMYLHRGAGAYICGEETGLISSLEGKKGWPKLKPPFPAVEGYLRCPTVVNNVETLACVPWIVNNGAAAYAKYGTPKSTGTKMFSVSGDVNRPGVYEIECGKSLRTLLDACGGIKGGRKLKAVIPGGSSAPIVTAKECEDMTLDYESIASKGSMLGSGGMIFLDETRDVVQVLKNLAEFYHDESCGQCTPCREGTGWVLKILHSFTEKQARAEDLKLLEATSNNMIGRTICVLADSIAMPALSYIQKFPEEFHAYLEKSQGSSFHG